MIRALQISDFPRWFLLPREGGANRARPRAALGLSPSDWRSLAKDSIRIASRSGRSAAFVWVENSRIVCLGIASQMSGPAGWEIQRLQVAPDVEGCVAEVVSALYDEAVRSSASWISARVAESDPVGPELCRGGLMPSHTEVLYCGYGRGDTSGPISGIREVKPVDESSLFRLHCASVPSEVRAIGAMTLEQWRSSRPHGIPGRVDGEEFLIENDGRVVGWIGLFRVDGRIDISMEVRPDRPDDESRSLLEFALSRVPKAAPVTMLVPNHQPAAGRAASSLGLAATDRFEVHTRSTRVSERIMRELGAYEVA